MAAKDKTRFVDDIRKAKRFEIMIFLMTFLPIVIRSNKNYSFVLFSILMIPYLSCS